MPVSISHKFIFVHIPKTAGGSITKLLEPYCLPRQRGSVRRLTSHFPIREDIDKVLIRGHDSASWIKTKIGTELFDDYFKFSVVRDPYTLAVSAYEFKRQSPRYLTREKINTMTFSEFLKTRSREKNSQFCKLADKKSQLLVHNFVHFEALKPEINVVLERIGLSERLGDNRINTSKKKSATDYLNTSTIRMINEIYAPDFEAFGYEKRS